MSFLKHSYLFNTTNNDNTTFRFNVSDLLERPSLSIKSSIFTLTTRNARPEKSPQITFSAAFRYIHRPITSSFGVHQSLQDLHKIMTTPISASHSHSTQSTKGHCNEYEELKLTDGEELKQSHHAEHSKITGHGKTIVTNGGLIYPHKRKVSSRRSFGESLDLKHIDDTSSCASSTITKNNTGAKQGPDISEDANSLHPRREQVTDDARSSSAPAFPEFTEKLTEASEFVKKNRVRRLNKPDQSGKHAK